MNKFIIPIIVIILLAGGAWFLLKNNSSQSMKTITATVAPTEMPAVSIVPSTSTTVASGQTVTIKNFAFSPANLVVKVGDTVTWTNEDSAPHSATADDGSFDTKMLSKGQSGTVTFSKAGTFAYHCSVHPNMTATITVQ